MNQYFSFTGCVILLFTLSIYTMIKNIYEILYPNKILDGQPTLDPFWKEGQVMTASCFLSSNKKWKSSDFNNVRVTHVGDFNNLTFDWNANQRNLELLLVSKTYLDNNNNNNNNNSSIQSNFSLLHHKLWRKLHENQTIYLHIHLTHNNSSPIPANLNYHPYTTIHKSIPLVKFGLRKNINNETKLLGKYFDYFKDNVTSKETTIQRLWSDYISYWKPEIALRLVTDFSRFPLKAVPPLVYNNIQIREIQSKAKYLPPMYVDEMDLTYEKLVPLNQTVESLPLKIIYEPICFAKWQLMILLESSLKTQKTIMQINDDEINNMRIMIAETNPYLLALATIVSLFHILFDCLAFKNDINFWKTNKSLVGISVKSMFYSLAAEIIIFFYLLDENTSMLVSVPAGITCIIQIWKIYKATGFQIKFFKINKFPYVSFVTSYQRLQIEQKIHSKTFQIDDIAMHHMSYILFPLLIGYSGFLLIYTDHKGWYSWLLKSLTGMVYTFGFIMMTPQLFINYKLKSVSHLPWKFLAYRAMNTFIDDIFAFIIPMPMLHRLSCFRDDIVFFIYIYQRWIYPVDKSRNSIKEIEEHEHND